MILNGYIATTYCKEITFFSTLLVWSSEAPGAWGHSIPLLYPS